MRLFLLLSCLYCFFNSSSLEAQATIEGTVEDVYGNPIQNASVVVSDAEQNILKYDYSNLEGRFLIVFETALSDYIILAANSLGFEEQRDTLEISDTPKSYSLSFTLREKTEQLNEVVLESTQKISGNGNVTTIQTEAFMDQTEQTVEDVLKKLPGIEVLDDGSIKAHGKYIRKLLIDGDDLFADDYQLLSKNLDAQTLDAVQIFDEFQDNPVLAKVLESDQVALNLQLKDELKNIWFGNALGGIGTEERVKASSNIGLLRKKVKFFYFGDYNNLGNKASAQLGGTASTMNISSMYREKQIEPKIEPVYSIDKKENHLFREGQSTFNKALMNSLGLMTKLSPKLELRATASYTNDVQAQLFSEETVFNVTEDPVHYFETSDVRHLKQIGAGELELKHTGGERSYLKNVLVYRNQPENYDSDLLFNRRAVFQDLKNNEASLYNHLNYSYVLSRKMVWHNYVYLGMSKKRQDALIHSPLLNERLSMPTGSEFEHASDDKLEVMGINANIFSKFGDFNHSLEIAYESLKEKRENKFFVVPAPEQLVEVDTLQNKLKLKQENLKLRTQLGYSFSEKVKLSLGLALDHLHIDIRNELWQGWLLQPEINLDLRKLNAGRFRFSYENTYRTPESSFFLQNYQLSSYNSFRRGLGIIHLIKSDVFNFIYRWANDLESQAVSLRIKYTNSDGIYSTSNNIEPDFVFSTYHFGDGGENFSGSLDFTSYFERLNLSTNLKTTQAWSAIPISVNSGEFTILRNHAASYFFSGTTYFNLPVNFSFRINLNRSQSNYNGIRSKTHWANAGLDLTYSFTSEWYASFDNDYYQMENDSYYFLGAKISYQPQESNFSYQLKINNLTDESNFTAINIDEYATYKSSFKLLPRYILLSMKYRF